MMADTTMQPGARARPSSLKQLADAFLKALAGRVAVRPNRPSRSVTLPTGKADADEVARVLAALDRTRKQQASDAQLDRRAVHLAIITPGVSVFVCRNLLKLADTRAGNSNSTNHFTPKGLLPATP
jgi:hypothetical protein